MTGRSSSLLRPRACALAVASIVLLFALGGVADAATCGDYWKGPNGGDWSTPGNWTAGVPTTASNVCIDNTYTSGSYQVDIDTYNPALVANSITVGGSAGNKVTLAILGTGGGVDVSNTLTLTGSAANSTITPNGALILGSAPQQELPGILDVDSGKLLNQGTITVESGGNASQLNGSFDNRGTLDLATAPLDSNSGTWSDEGTIDIPSGQTLQLTASGAGSSFTLNGGTIANSGTMTVNGGAFATAGAADQTGNPPILDIASITLPGTGAGTFVTNTGTSGENLLNGTIASGYTLDIAGNGGYDNGLLTTGSAVTNEGTIDLGSDSGVGVDTYGAIDATGGTLTNNGTIDSTGGNTNGLNGAFVNNGALNVNEPLNMAPSAFTTSGTIDVASGQTLAVNTNGGENTFTQTAGTIANAGKLSIEDGTVTASGGTATGNAIVLGEVTIDLSGSGSGIFHEESCAPKLGSDIGSDYTLRDSGAPGYCNNTLAVPSSVTNHGTLILGAEGTSGALNVTGGTFTNAGTVDFSAAGLNGAFVNAGTVLVPTSFGGSGVITNDGTFTVSSGATIAATSYAQSSGGTLALSASGSSSPPVPEFQLTGAASLAGNLSIMTSGTVTGTFPVFAAGSLSGTFATPTFSGETYSLAYSATGLALTGPASPGTGPGTGSGTAPTLSVSAIRAVGGKVAVELTCGAGSGACAAGAVAVTTKEHLSGEEVTATSARATKKKAKPKTKVVTIASGTATLTAGTTKTLTLSLDRTGASLLSRLHKLSAEVRVTASGKPLRSGVVTIKAQKKTKKTAKKH
jgi:fibronectin-binding autotransporter adhesin